VELLFNKNAVPHDPHEIFAAHPDLFPVADEVKLKVSDVALETIVPGDVVPV
jgi:hypothetical protein